MLARSTKTFSQVGCQGLPTLAARKFFSKPAAPAQKPPPEVISIAEAETLLFNGIKSIGYSDADAIVMRDCMMWAQLRDNNQGMIKLTSGGLAKSGDGQPTIEIDSPTGARVNGNLAMSMPVMDFAINLAIEKAQSAKVGVVGTFNTSQSCGALGFYAEKIAKAGMIGVLMVTSPEFVAPHGAKQAILGTNPITCAVPTDQGTFLMDQATAGFPWFGLLEAKTAGIEIPEGVAFDSEGQPTRDPNKALKGALRTFDRGYKSSNLALMVELLAGPLVGAAHVNKLAAKNWGNLVVAIHPSLLGDAATFYKNAGEVLERVRNADRLPGVDKIVIAGEMEAQKAAARVAEGTLPIESNMLGELRAMAHNYTSQAGSSSASGGGATADRQVQLLEKLLSRIDQLEHQVTSNAQQQAALGRQQQRLETVTAESLSALRSANGHANMKR